VISAAAGRVSGSSSISSVVWTRETFSRSAAVLTVMSPESPE
jgi:hypothetical protein